VVKAEVVKECMVLATVPRFAFHAQIDPQDPRTALMAKFFYSRLREMAPPLTRIYEGWIEVLDTLKAKEHPLAVLSNNEGQLIRRIIGHHGISHYFPIILGEEDVAGKVKPAADGLLALARFWDVPIQNLTMVGDSASDFGAARRAGCRAVGVCWGAHQRQELEPMGWDFLADTPADLLKLITSAEA
jgi:phosphoglycolate phosphatase